MHTMGISTVRLNMLLEISARRALIYFTKNRLCTMLLTSVCVVFVINRMENIVIVIFFMQKYDRILQFIQ